jgi:putative ABC transport system permease protein
MFKTLFHTAFRNLKRRWGFTLLNFTGLTIGLSVCGLVALYVQHELTFDSHHPGSKETYRVSGKKSSGWFAPLTREYSDALYTNPPAYVEKVVRVRRWPSKFIVYGDTKLFEEKVLITDHASSFFTVFAFPVVHGKLPGVLNANEAVITQSLARRMFGANDPVGEMIEFDTFRLTVVAVLEDLPSNTHLSFNLLFAEPNAMAQASGLFTYVVMPDASRQNDLKEYVQTRDVTTAKINRLEDSRVIPLQRLHFEGNLTFEMNAGGNKSYLIVFTVIGLLIFMICCTNYINLSVAMYAERNKEMAIRKVSGAGHSALAWQIWFESILLCVCAVPLALDVIEVSLPFINEGLQIRLRNVFLYSFKGLLLFIMLGVLMGFVAGFYPAVIMPRMKIVALFRNVIPQGREGLELRKSMVFFQFFLISLFAVTAWFIHQQLTFLHTTDLGFKKEGVIKITRAWGVDSLSYQRLKQQLLTHPSVAFVSEGLAPGDEDYGIPFKAEGSDVVYDDALSLSTDTDYLDALGIVPVEGPYFALPPKQKPSRSLLVNQMLLKRLGWEHYEGKKIILWPGTEHERATTIDGVFKDFHFYSLHNPITPQLLFVRPYSQYVDENILVKLNRESSQAILAFVQETINELLPDEPLQVEYLEDDLRRFYEHEDRLAAAIKLMFTISMVLSIAALIGLSSYSMLLRRKEVGVRKVLGATTVQILALLTLQFLRFIGLAVVGGAIVAFVCLHVWLQNFAFRITVNPAIVMMIMLLVMLCTVMTILYQSLRASQVNPVQCLRNE